MERPIDVLCEEERLRRLSERVTFDGGDSAEPARQRRARILVEEMTTLGPRLRSKSNEDRRFKAIRALEAGLHARWKAVVHEMSEGHKGPSERVRKAAEEDLERTAVPVPTPHPTIPEDIHSKLLDALEGVTVRAVVGLRGLTEVPPNVEAVTLAVLHLVSCEYLGQMGLGPEAPENWEEARRVLLKPGHFVSSLRKFPSSLEQGQVNDSNIIFAQKKLLQIGNAASTGLAEVHEGAVQLYHWLRAALQLAPSSLVAAAASPARASASPPDPLQPAYPRSAPSSPQHKKEEVKPSPSKTTPKAAPVRPMSPKAAYRTPLAAKSVSNGYPKSPNNSATSATISTSRSAGFNLSWSTLSAGTGGAAKSQPKPSRVSTTGVSPRRRSSPSPTPALTGKQPVSSKGVYVAKAQPLRPRNSLNGTASPQPTRPQAKDLEVKPPSFARSRSAGRETKSQEVVATGGSNLSFASISTAAMPTSKDFAGIRIRLDQEKKEVRQMRGMESQLKWDMLREERNQTEEERREEARRIMEWRDREAKEMREYVEGKSRDQRLHELLESKEYQEFKRAWKQAMRKEEIERIKVQLAENLDNAQWRLELQRALDLDRQMALQENMEAQQELRELKEKERQREKVMQEEDRVHDLTLEYAHQAQQISTEKEALLRSLALLRERQKAPVAGTATKAGTTIWPLAR